MASDTKATDNVTAFPSPVEMTTPDMALREAIERGLNSVLVIGETPDGKFYVRSSGDVTRKDALWFLEHARINALGLYGDDDDVE